MKFFNQRRLRDYPRIMLITMTLVMVFNILFREGWLGASGQLIGGDFIIFYGGGYQYRNDIGTLYDIQVQGQVQQMLVEPTRLWGANIYPYPPYVAAAHSLLTYLSLSWVFLIHSVLSILFTIASAWLLTRYLTPGQLSENGLSFFQLSVIGLSFFPFVVGFQTGQNHGLTLLLVTIILVCTHKEKWWLAGLFAGLLVYKPQFALGFLILWFFWGKWQALVSFGIVALGWSGIVILQHGITPYLDYLQAIPAIMLLPFFEGGGGYLEVAPYGLLVTLLSLDQLPLITRIYQFTTTITIITLSGVAFYTRAKNEKYRLLAIMAALLFPLLSSPHAILHDAIILVPFFILWSRLDLSRQLLVRVIIIYAAAFFLTPIAYFLDTALLAIIPIWLAIELFLQIRKPWITSLQPSTN